MNVQELLAELRSLIGQAAKGTDISARRKQIETELKGHGIVVQPSTAEPSAQQRQEAVDMVRREMRSGSRYVGQGADAAYVRELAAGRLPSAAGAQYAARSGDATSARSGLAVVKDLKAATMGDGQARQRLASQTTPFKSDEEKAIVGGAFLVPMEQIVGYLDALAPVNPIRALAAQHDVATGRKVLLTVEDDTPLVTEHTPEAGQKPASDLAVTQIEADVHKVAGITDVSDELLADSQGQVEDMIARSFATSIGTTIDVALLNGTGIGQPLGILRHPAVNHTALGSNQEAMALFVAIMTALSKLTGRYLTGLSVVVHPSMLLRFDTDLDGNGNLRFPDGLRGILGSKGASVTVDPNLPVAVDGTCPIVVGAFQRGLHFCSRSAVALDQSNAPGFQTDETTFRAVERYAAVVAKASCFEVIDGTDLTTPVF